VRRADLECFVALLLQLALHCRPGASNEKRKAYQPIPISGVSAGELVDGMGCLGVTIGGTELMFQLPVSAFSDLARTMLVVGSDPARVLS